MSKKLKILILVVTIIIALGAIFFIWKLVKSSKDSNNPSETEKNSAYQTNQQVNVEKENIKTTNDSKADADERKPVGDFANLVKEKFITASQPLDKTKPFNVLILGIDRRTPDDSFYRTDVIQIASFNPSNNKVLFTSIPRDLWVDGNKINAYYILAGGDALKEKIKQITGLTITRIVRVDFDALVWAVDSVGGVEVNVPRGFVDEEYPQDRDGLDGVKTVEYTEGTQIMDGETALIYSRSRKGSNGEGSDFARSARQQILMEAAPKAFLSTKSLFMPFVAGNVYNLVTGKIYTDISLSDVSVLYDIIKNHDKLTYANFNLGYENLINPPLEDYGGAWVLVAKDNDYTQIQNRIKEILGIN